MFFGEFKQGRYSTLAQRYGCVREGDTVIKDVVELIAEGLSLMPDGKTAEGAGM